MEIDGGDPYCRPDIFTIQMPQRRRNVGEGMLEATVASASIQDKILL